MRFCSLFLSVLGCGGLLTLCGCVTTTTKNGRVIANEPSAVSKQWSNFKSSAAGMVAAITPKDSVDPIAWRWSAGIPQSVAKIETFTPAAPMDAVLAFAPNANVGAIRLVSTEQPTAIPISVVNEKRIHTLADLHAQVLEALDSPADAEPTVEFALPGASQQPVPVKLTKNNLVALAHTTIPDRSPIRVVEESNPWVLIKDDGVRCKVMLRTEQHTDLVHLAISLKVCWGPPVTLPVDLHVYGESRELPCLNVSQVLGRMYDDANAKSKKRSDAEKPVTTFAQIAGDDEYLIPVNYRELEAKQAANNRLASVRPMPAFAVVGEYAYPGPPVLGDARALSSFLLQPATYSADQPEQVGWVVFDARQSAPGENYKVVIDLGSGPQEVMFRIPRAES